MFVRVFQTYTGYGDFVYGPNDDRPDNIPDDLPTIVEKIRERAPVDAALAKSSGMDVSRSWLEVPTDDLDDDTGPLDKGLIVVTTKAEPAPVGAPISKASGTLAKRLGIVSTTIRRDADGVGWLRGFNAAGEMVDCRTMLDVRE